MRKRRMKFLIMNIFLHIFGALCELKSEYADLQKEITLMKKSIDLLNAKVSSLEHPHYGVFCARRYWGVPENFIVTYNELTHVATNLDGPGLDVDTGLFTAGLSGTWSITFSLLSTHSYSFDDSTPEHNNVNLYKNGELIPESYFYTMSEADLALVSGRTIYIHLEMGDQVYLATDFLDGSVNLVTICYQLITTGPMI